MFWIFETLGKKLISDEPDIKKPSITPTDKEKERDLTGTAEEGVINIDMNYLPSTLDDFNFSGSYNIVSLQRRLIEKYRGLVSNPEINRAVDLIVTEVIYTPTEERFKISLDEENEKIKDTIYKEFEEILNIINVDDNIFSIVRQAFVDGQLNVAIGFDKSDLKKGIKKVYILDPRDLVFDKKNRMWVYVKDEEEYLYGIEEEEPNQYEESELIHIDFGLHKKIRLDEHYYKLNLSYLENVYKLANQLEALENLLVPFRYSRSVSRRMFDVDIGNLPPKLEKEALNKIKKEFQYKKYFDTETGEIKNLRNAQPLVEDYWFTSRGGSRGTRVDVMDERGSALDMEDIKHIGKKIYQALGIPGSRNPYSDNETYISFDNTQVTQEEYGFYVYISRLRRPFIKLLYELLRRNLIAKGIIQDNEWKKLKSKLKIEFSADALFLDNMKKDVFMKSVDSFDNIKDQIGKNISLETALKNTFGWGQEQIEEEFEKIKNEKENELYKIFFGDEEDSGRRW